MTTTDPFRSDISINDKNIARGTTDPEIDSITWIELGNNMAQLTLVGKDLICF